MRTVGLITEYNPFHNGHQYHIEKAKELTGADAVIVVMSGNFVQRGTPAIMDKFLRAKAAVLGGADLVFELPACYASASAEFFAEGAVRLLNSLGTVDFICFGSECGDIAILTNVAEILLSEPDKFKESLKQQLKSGSNFAKARADAFLECYPEYSEVIKSPNNILGIEYIKAIKKIHSNIVPCTIARKGNNYHDDNCSYELSSATAVRKLFNEATATDKFTRFVPAMLSDLYKGALNTSFPITENDFSSMLYYKLVNDINNKLSLSQYFEVSDELANRIVKLLPRYNGFSNFAMLLKNKSLTYSRICRGLTHILLNIKQADIDDFKENGWIFYARLLAMSNSSIRSEALKNISNNSDTILITSLKKAFKGIVKDEPFLSSAQKQLAIDMLADDLYQHVAAIKYNTQPIAELSRNFIKNDRRNT